MSITMTERTLGDLVSAADKLGVDLHVLVRAKQPTVYRCKYCRSPMAVSAPAYDEDPFCIGCLYERMTRTLDPLDAPRIRCGLPLSETSPLPEISP